MKSTLRGVLAIAFAFATGCGSEASFVEVSFREAAAETTPVVVDVAARLPVLPVEPPGVLKEVYSLLRSYDPALDLTNMYRVLADADRARDFARSCLPGEPRPIASPFPLGIEDTYTCAINEANGEPASANAAAIRDDTSSHHALLGFRFVPADQTALAVVQGHFDDVTGELAIGMANLVLYSEITPGKGLGFGLRTAISGNLLTHEFELRALVRNVEIDPQHTTSIVGAGNSQQPGTSFLLRITASGQNTVDGRYYCIPANADLATISALDPAGTVVPDAACAALAARVDALVPFVRADAPDERADFVGGDVYLPL